MIDERDADSATRRGSEPGTPNTLAKCVLVVEDEAIVGMLLEDELAERGYRMVGPFDSCADAMHWLATNTPDLAVLDVEVKDGPCTAVAVELHKRGVKFVVFSGSIASAAPAPFQVAPWFEKPSDLRALLARLAHL